MRAKTALLLLVVKAFLKHSLCTKYAFIVSDESVVLLIHQTAGLMPLCHASKPTKHTKGHIINNYYLYVRI